LCGEEFLLQNLEWCVLFFELIIFRY